MNTYTQLIENIPWETLQDKTHYLYTLNPSHAPLSPELLTASLIIALLLVYVISKSST